MEQKESLGVWILTWSPSLVPQDWMAVLVVLGHAVGRETVGREGNAETPVIMVFLEKWGQKENPVEMASL